MKQKSVLSGRVCTVLTAAPSATTYSPACSHCATRWISAPMRYLRTDAFGSPVGAPQTAPSTAAPVPPTSARSRTRRRTTGSLPSSSRTLAPAPIARSSFSLPTALESAMTLVRERATSHGIALSLRIDQGIEFVDADERKVRQVVLNLLSNAVKFTPDGGRVELSGSRLDGEIRVAVRDTGSAARRRSVSASSRSSSRRARHAVVRAPGLGLALAQRFVELHAGRIWVESEVGKGSTFTFTLPAGPPSARAPWPDGGSNPARGGQGVRPSPG